MFSEFMDGIVKVIIAIISGSIGASLGAWLTRRREKRKAEAERLRNACETCLGLQELLAAWYNAIEDAVLLEESPIRRLPL
jgi:hypothetical protein